MPANQQIVIKGGEATPLDHTYFPSKIDSNGVAMFEERVAGGIPAGYPRITAAVRAPSGDGKTFKETLKITIPSVVNQTVNGVTTQTVAFTEFANVELMHSAISTKAQRTDLRARTANLLINSIMAAALDDLESFW